jgi:hypothetical protein
MFLKQKALVAAIALLAAASSQAQVAVTADLGTTGAGAHLVVPMESNLNGRFGLNYLKHDFSKRSGEVDYDLRGKLATFDVLFDWYVRDNSALHLTGGLVYNGSSFNGTGKASLGSFMLNGHGYTAADVGSLTGTVQFRKIAPYLGIGWGNPLKLNGSRWQFNADLGAYYQGNANVHMVSIGCVTSQAVCKMLASDVAAETARLREDASSYKFYPVLRAAVSYRF